MSENSFESETNDDEKTNYSCWVWLWDYGSLEDLFRKFFIKGWKRIQESSFMWMENCQWKITWSKTFSGELSSWYDELDARLISIRGVNGAVKLVLTTAVGDSCDCWLIWIDVGLFLCGKTPAGLPLDSMPITFHTFLQVFFTKFFTFWWLIFVYSSRNLFSSSSFMSSSPPNSYTIPHAITSFDFIFPKAFSFPWFMDKDFFLLIVCLLNRTPALHNTRLTFNQKLRKLNVCTFFIQ